MDAQKVQGYDRVAYGHLAAAYCVVSQDADACLATRSAAQTFGLDFIPLHSERYDLVMRKRTADLPAVKAFLDVLQRATLRRKLEVLAGYDTSKTGTGCVASWFEKIRNPLLTRADWLWNTASCEPDSQAKGRVESSCQPLLTLDFWRPLWAEFDWNLPPGFPRPAVPADNPMSAAKVELGRYLFYDKRMSVNGKESCGSCHRQELAFTDGRARAEGDHRTTSSTQQHEPG